MMLSIWFLTSFKFLTGSVIFDNMTSSPPGVFPYCSSFEAEFRTAIFYYSTNTLAPLALLTIRVDIGSSIPVLRLKPSSFRLTNGTISGFKIL